MMKAEIASEMIRSRTQTESTSIPRDRRVLDGGVSGTGEGRLPGIELMPSSVYKARG